MPHVSHEVRNSSIDPTRLFALEGDGLVWRETDRQTKRLYADIQSLHLVAYAGPGGRHLQCTLIDRAGQKVKIRSHHYVGLARFEDRTTSYGSFVRELVVRLGAQGHDVGFHQGSRRMRIVWMILFGLSVLVLVGFLAALIGGAPLSPNAVFPISVSTLFLPVSWHMIGKNRAGTFDPQSPPLGFLGKA